MQLCPKQFNRCISMCIKWSRTQQCSELRFKVLCVALLFYHFKVWEDYRHNINPKTKFGTSCTAYSPVGEKSGVAISIQVWANLFIFQRREGEISYVISVQPIFRFAKSISNREIMSHAMSIFVGNKMTASFCVALTVSKKLNTMIDCGFKTRLQKGNHYVYDFF